MGTIGSWWVSSHESRPDERVLGSYHVNYLQPDGRPLGGKLYRTDQRLLFSPHLLDSLLGGGKVGVELDGVDDVTLVEGGAGDEAGPGSTTDRLRLECDDGSVYSFVVDDLEAAIEDIRVSLETEDRST